MDEAGCNMNSLRKQAPSSRCDSTSTIKLILYNVTVAVSQNLRLWVCVDSVGGGGPCVFKAHWHHPEALHSTCIRLRKLFLFQGLSYTLGWCLYDIIWAFQCSSVCIYCKFTWVFFFFEQTQKQFSTQRQSIQIKHTLYHVLGRSVLNPGLKAFFLTATGTISCRQTIIHIREWAVLKNSGVAGLLCFCWSGTSVSWPGAKSSVL